MYKILEKTLKAFNASDKYIGDIARELEKLGVEDLIEDGRIMLHTGVKVLGKGQNSVVITCRYRGRICACKILRPDASRPDLIHEAEMLKIANKAHVGPILYTYSRRVIIMELIKGISVERFIEAEDNVEKVRKVIRDAFLQAHRLDMIGLEHGELTRPEEHIVVSGDRVYIIDFESSKYRGRKISKNLTQIVNALVIGGSRAASRVRSILNIYDTRSVIALLREYKREPSGEIVNKVLELLNV